MAAAGHAPFIHDDLVGADPGRAPLGVGGDARKRFAEEIERGSVDGHGVLDAHHELNIKRPPKPPLFGHSRRLEDVRQVECLDLGLDIVLQHLGSQPVDQIRWVFVDAGRKVVGPYGQRGHVGFERKHPAAFLSCTRAAAGRELDDHARTVFFETFFQLCETFGIRGRGLVFQSHVRMADRRARLEGFLCGFHLLRNGDRHRRVIVLARHRPGDGDADDGRLGHVPAIPPSILASVSG